MKKFLFFLSFLLFNSFLAFAAEELNPVLDANGEEIRTGQQYYILPLIWGPAGGGLSYGRNPGNEICPLAVVQSPFEVFRGVPVTFTPANPDEGVVRVSTDLNIKFAIPIIGRCDESNVWKLHFDVGSKQHIILTDGVEGNPGCETIPNWFKIEAIGTIGYKLVFRPTVCDPGYEVVHGDVGIFDHDNTRYLGLSDEPYRVVFVKKNEEILKSVTST